MTIKPSSTIPIFVDPHIYTSRTDTERLSYDVVCLDSCQAFR